VPTQDSEEKEEEDNDDESVDLRDNAEKKTASLWSSVVVDKPT
jgi:hypothetical protein